MIFSTKFFDVKSLIRDYTGVKVSLAKFQSRFECQENDLRIDGFCMHPIPSPQKRPENRWNLAYFLALRRRKILRGFGSFQNAFLERESLSVRMQKPINAQSLQRLNPKSQFEKLTPSIYTLVAMFFLRSVLKWSSTIFCFVFKHDYADRVDICNSTFKKFPQTRPEVWCDLECFVALGSINILRKTRWGVGGLPEIYVTY